MAGSTPLGPRRMSSEVPTWRKRVIASFDSGTTMSSRISTVCSPASIKRLKRPHLTLPSPPPGAERGNEAISA
jgi:hypothetical protein